MVLCILDEGGSAGEPSSSSGQRAEGNLHKRCSGLRLSLKPEWQAQLEKALLHSVHRAKKQHRLRIGLYNSLRVLEQKPQKVTICILPIFESRDPLSHVQTLLVNAYCKEHCIRILKVHSPENLLTIAKHTTETDTEGGSQSEEDDEEDDSIVLLLNSSVHHTSDDALLAAFDAASLRCEGHPEISLPNC